MSLRRGTYSVKRWAKSVFTKRYKEITPRPRPKKPNAIAIFRNKIKKIKGDESNIELLETMDANKLKEEFSIFGSRAKVLDKMVQDYNTGRLSLPGLTHKSKFDAKSLNRIKLNKLIKQYDERSREGEIDEAKQNAAIIKKKFKMSDREANKVEKLLVDLSKGQGSELELLKDLLEPDHLTKERLDKYIKQYDHARKLNRGPSYLISQGRPSYAGPKRRISDWMEHKVLKKHR